MLAVGSHAICDSASCYGSDIRALTAAAAGTFAALFAVGIHRIVASAEPEHRPRTRRKIGRWLSAAATPAGFCTAAVLTNRFCGSSTCSGDYMVMALISAVCGLVIGLVVLVVGLGLIASAPNERPDNPPSGHGVGGSPSDGWGSSPTAT